MALLRSDFTRLLQQQLVDIFWENYTEVGSVWRALFSEQSINTPYVERQSLLGMGDLVEKGENEPFSYDQPTVGWPILGSVKSFGKAMAFSRELYDDSQFLNLFGESVAQIAQNYDRTRDRYYAQFLNYGALTAGHRVFNATVPGVIVDPTGDFIYDGKPLFAGTAQAHPSLMSDRTFSNYDTLDLTLENIQKVYTKMTVDNAYDEQGNKIVISPDTIVVPQELELEALALMNQEYVAQDATTGIGGASARRNPFYRKFRIIVWPHLTTADGWFMIQRGYGLRALIRQQPEIEVWEDPETKQMRASVYCRFGAYADSWRHLFANNIPQAIA